MKIIEKIEIKYFRSFLDKKVEILNLNDLNIFSGKNDCGKSNILRALNLFFNYETDLGKPINFHEDFSKFRKVEIKLDKETRSQGAEKEIREQRSFISIKVYFNLTVSGSSYSLPDKFWISRTWKPRSEYNRPDEKDNIVVEYKKKNKGNLKKGYEGRLA
ncbi:MAG: AAA family ATPase, partial [Spirochaetia bacterium]|nr:AAA family ATPase [Spirochaetia bacterium]